MNLPERKGSLLGQTAFFSCAASWDQDHFIVRKLFLRCASVCCENVPHGRVVSFGKRPKALFLSLFSEDQRRLCRRILLLRVLNACRRNKVKTAESLRSQMKIHRDTHDHAICRHHGGDLLAAACPAAQSFHLFRAEDGGLSRPFRGKDTAILRQIQCPDAQCRAEFFPAGTGCKSALLSLPALD